ncbi:MAG: site-2 protease family protein, partial [Candidatus Saccharimonadales bacterium]
LGDDTARLQGRLTINPIKHIDPFMTILLPLMLAISGAPVFGGAKPVPFNPNKVRGDEWGIALVAIAGPLTNFLIAFVVFGIWALVNPQVEIINQFFMTAVYVNLGFFIFNIIPIPPLDGSRVLYALAPDFVRKVMESIERFGVMIVFAFVLIASPLLMRFMSDVMSTILNLFLFIFGF